MNIVYTDYDKHQEQKHTCVDLGIFINDHISKGYLEERTARIEAIVGHLLYKSCIDGETTLGELADMLDADGIDFKYGNS